MPADDGAELFAIVDPDTGADTGKLLPRATAHATGAWHRVVHVCVWSPEGALLLQRRSADKSVNPGAWDLSAAEHVRPGEELRAAAVRGLREELGLVLPNGEADLSAPEPDRRQVTADEAAGLLDSEIVRTFHVRGWPGHVRELAPDPTEVSELRWVEMSELVKEVQRDAGVRLTPWFLEEGRARGWW